MGQLLHLESFDSSAQAVISEHPEYTRGRADGHTAGMADAAAQQDGHIQDVTSLLTQAQFSYAEARQAVLADLSSVIDATMSQLLPQIATLGLVARLRDELLISYSENTAIKTVLHVPPRLQKICEDTIAQTCAGQVTVKSDPQLGDHALWFERNNGDTYVDFENLLNAVRSALSCLNQTNQGNKNHG
jgi:flagellar biosynthesis/type III secretory pathway protein FliH